MNLFTFYELNDPFYLADNPFFGLNANNAGYLFEKLLVINTLHQLFQIIPQNHINLQLHSKSEQLA